MHTAKKSGAAAAGKKLLAAEAQATATPGVAAGRARAKQWDANNKVAHNLSSKRRRQRKQTGKPKIRPELEARAWRHLAMFLSSGYGADVAHMVSDLMPDEDVFLTQSRFWKLPKMDYIDEASEDGDASEGFWKLPEIEYDDETSEDGDASEEESEDDDGDEDDEDYAAPSSSSDDDDEL